MASSDFGLDRVDHAVLAGERAAEDEEARVHEPVHEGVLRPPGMLLERSREVVPRGPERSEHDEEHRHAPF